MDPMEKSQEEVYLLFLYSDCVQRATLRHLDQAGTPGPGLQAHFQLSTGVRQGGRCPQASGTAALQPQVLGRGPLVVEAFPWGHCITTHHHTRHSASTPSPVWPTTSLPPGSTHSSLTGGCGPFPEQSCPPSAFWAKRVRFHPFSL